MKIQNLAVVFIVIILPIAIVLSTYVNNLIDVANIQKNYDSILYNATYDAVRAYQMNTLNNSFASVNTSRDRDINASVNSFFNSLATGLGSSGYTKNSLKYNVPAILFTLYDGYYVYGSYDNYASVTSSNSVNFNTSSGKADYGVMPFEYYSCEYVNTNAKNGFDLTINYTLDNYISISGWYKDEKDDKVEENYITSAGYYINTSDISINDTDKSVKITRSGKEITLEKETLKEYISFYDDDKSEAISPKLYQYINYKNVKYYLESEDNIFYLRNDERVFANNNLKDDIKNFLGIGEKKITLDNFKDINYYYYYKNACQFSNDVNSILKRIDVSKDVKSEFYNKTYDIINSNGDKITEASDTTNKTTSHVKHAYSTSKVFDTSISGNDPELEGSSFNQHRMDVIIASVESRLTNMIANYNYDKVSTYDYKMPTLSETDWYNIANNVTTLSFLQGIVVGNYKYYNNYSLVTNTTTKEFVSKNGFYVQDVNPDSSYQDRINVNYHDPRCTEYNAALPSNVKAYRMIDYKIQSFTHNYKTTEEHSQVMNYYMHPEIGAYECIVSLNDNKIEYDDLLELKDKVSIKDKNGSIIEQNLSPNIEQAFIQGLAREKNALTKDFEVYNIH